MRLHSVLLASALAALLPALAVASLVGVTYDGRVLSLNESTGTGAVVGSSGLFGFNSLARNSAGVYYSATDIFGLSVLDLVTINPATGAAAVAATLNFGVLVPSVRGLAFSPTDTLFAISRTAGNTTDPALLFIVNAATGAGTLVGSTGLGLQSLAFSPSGVLYGYDIGLDVQVGLGLVIIDPATGAVTDVNPAVGSDGPMQSIAFDASGTLYGILTNNLGNAQLYTINPATGTAISVGGGSVFIANADIRGIECVTCPAAAAAIPEPATLALVGGSLLLLARVRARKTAASQKPAPTTTNPAQ
ncbi:MAG: hypothetical protein HY235_20920 [Acidobacteria bacterium]|nr:hypothetical protein [Acidobacteriota bacterium]